MTPDETAAVYDRIAEHWDCHEFNSSNGIAQHERALRFVATFGNALDVGCGSSGRIIALLQQRGFTVEGLDVSAEMLRRARRRHPDVLFHAADICSWAFSRHYDFISAWDSVWHVPLDRQLDVLRKLCTGLARHGVLIFITGGVDAPEEITHPCFGEPLYHAAPGVAAILQTLDECRCAVRHVEYDQYPEKHVYLIAQRL